MINKYKLFQSSLQRRLFVSKKMPTLRNKRKLAAVTRETQEELPRNGQSRNTSVLKINEEYIQEVSEDTDDRVQEYNWTESRILGALSKVVQFLLNPQIRTHSGTVLGTFRNTNVENQEPNEDRSQDDPHPELDPPSVNPVIQLTQTLTRLLTVSLQLRLSFINLNFF